MTVEEYATVYLQQEIQLVKNKPEPLLTNFEKAIIYKYSDTGYEDVNELLRLNQGQNLPLFAQLLNECLSKLPDYEGVVYRGEDLSKMQAEIYISAFANGQVITKRQFFSSSRSKQIANMFGKTSVKIYSKTGKMIEHIANFGINDSQNEREVLFRCNTSFEVVDILQDERGNLLNVVLYEI
ncbi:ADP-ribosyltransferase [Runella limosa]|uniref:ADP-ribosyltransferase n=1 Tax=Runella limosa TaxID=370978 RepID=UPI000413CEFE|nr:ADP-ribosyltransferase [Runella limosa]